MISKIPLSWGGGGILICQCLQLVIRLNHSGKHRRTWAHNVNKEQCLCNSVSLEMWSLLCIVVQYITYLIFHVNNIDLAAVANI